MGVFEDFQRVAENIQQVGAVDLQTLLDRAFVEFQDYRYTDYSLLAQCIGALPADKRTPYIDRAVSNFSEETPYSKTTRFPEIIRIFKLDTDDSHRAEVAALLLPDAIDVRRVEFANQMAASIESDNKRYELSLVILDGIKNAFGKVSKYYYADAMIDCLTFIPANERSVHIVDAQKVFLQHGIFEFDSRYKALEQLMPDPRSDHRTVAFFAGVGINFI